MRKIISNYDNAVLDFRANYQIYKMTHINFISWLKQRKNKQTVLSDAQKIFIERNINKKNIFIDSFGYFFNKGSICIENIKYEKIFHKILDTKKKFYTTNNFFSDDVANIIKKESPQYVVFFYATVLRYNTIEKLAELINFFKKKLEHINLLLFIDIIYLDFNKIKYTNKDAIEILARKINSKSLCQKISEFDYLIEVI